MTNVVKQLRQIQADSQVLFVKFHNYHWNVKGLQFAPIHAMTEKIYDSLADVFDAAAERILQLGGEPLVTIKEIMEITTVKEESARSFDAKSVLEKTLTELEKLLRQWNDLSREAEVVRDISTMSMADEQGGELEKQIWILKAMLG